LFGVPAVKGGAPRKSTIRRLFRAASHAANPARRIETMARRIETMARRAQKLAQ